MSVNREMSMSLAKVIKKHREKQGMSLAKLAELTATDQTYPGKIERGISSPTIDVCKAFAKALKVPLWKLIKQAEK